MMYPEYIQAAFYLMMVTLVIVDTEVDSSRYRCGRQTLRPF